MLVNSRSFCNSFQMLKRLILLLDVLSVFWVGLIFVSFQGIGTIQMILIFLVPYGLLRWVLVGSPIPFTNKEE